MRVSTFLYILVLSLMVCFADNHTSTKKSLGLTFEPLARAMEQALLDIENSTIQTQSEQFIKNVIKEKKYRSYAELKKDYEKMTANVETELDIVKKLFTRIYTAESKDHWKKLLYDLEYYLHQVDNAKHFADIGGIKLFCDKIMTNPGDPTVSDILYAFSSAVRSNPDIQVTAMKVNCMTALRNVVDVLHRKLEASEVTLAESNQFFARLLTAYSSILGNFPHAQNEWIKFGDFDRLLAFFNLLEDRTRRSGIASTRFTRTLGKLFTLVGDLLNERESMKWSSNMDGAMRQKQQQYDITNFSAIVEKSGWCNKLFSVLISMNRDSDILHTRDHEVLEKILRSAEASQAACRFFSTSLEVKKSISEIGKIYEDLLKSDAENSFYSDLLLLVKSLQNVITAHEEL